MFETFIFAFLIGRLQLRLVWWWFHDSYYYMLRFCYLCYDQFKSEVYFDHTVLDPSELSIIKILKVDFVGNH